MAILVDTRGLSCPQPVVLFHQALKSGNKEIEVLVDNNASRENVTRAAEGKGLHVVEHDMGQGVWKLEITFSA